VYSVSDHMQPRLNTCFPFIHKLQLERFLIANRDEYLRHSSQNYTLAQKQYNNWLTERLMEVAEEYRYEFDPEDFNFVGIRDRIRCYYKSYVQTARKRGLAMPSVRPASPPKGSSGDVPSKKAKVKDAEEGQEDQNGHDKEEEEQQEESKGKGEAPAKGTEEDPPPKAEEPAIEKEAIRDDDENKIESSVAAVVHDDADTAATASLSPDSSSRGVPASATTRRSGKTKARGAPT